MSPEVVVLVVVMVAGAVVGVVVVLVVVVVVVVVDAVVGEAVVDVVVVLVVVEASGPPLTTMRVRSAVGGPNLEGRGRRVRRGRSSTGGFTGLRLFFKPEKLRRN